MGGYNTAVIIDDVVSSIDTGSAVSLPAEEVSTLLDRAELLQCFDTGLAGPIRTLRLDGRVLVQESDPEGRHFVRGLPSEEAAERFVASRLAAYERMWDG